jgi:hypothetical protein
MVSNFVRKWCFFFLTGFVALPCFAQQNPYQGITSLSSTKFTVLFEDYIERNKLKDRHGFYFDNTVDIVRFLEQFENLEILDLIALEWRINKEDFLQELPLLPNIKSLRVNERFLSQGLSWVTNFPLLEEITINAFEKDVDVAPLADLKHLSKLNLWGVTDEEKLIHAEQLPTSLTELHLEGFIVDPNDLNHLRLKKLALRSRFISSLPKKESLVDLDFLDLTNSSISDLSPLQSNQNLRVFNYSHPTREGLRANFDVIKTWTNLEELTLFGFPKNHATLRKGIEGLSNLRSLSLSGRKIGDLSFLEGMNLHELSMPVSLLALVPRSVLLNPQLVSLDPGGLEFPDGIFSWDDFSPNLSKLDLGYSDYCDLSQLTRFPLVNLNCESIEIVENGKDLIAFAPTLESLTSSEEVMLAVIDAYGEEILSSFVKLKHLNLELGRSKSFDSLDFLKRFPRLEEIEIHLPRKMPPEALDVFLEMKHLKKIDLMGHSLESWVRAKELAKLGVPIH